MGKVKHNQTWLRLLNPWRTRRLEQAYDRVSSELDRGIALLEHNGVDFITGKAASRTTPGRARNLA
jgi:hypothetical protein